MATERWDDEKLDRLAEIVMDIASEARNARQDLAETRQIVESNARAIQATNESIDSLNNKLEQTIDVVNGNARVIQSIANAIGEAAEERQEFRQSIRGLQYENRQILDILLNRQNEEDNLDAS